ncbi:hypothetical protein ACKUB1_16680 [Methanospirillum stamsii]|uniref:Uncharacterized protein n=1 Tax=Methanospirillum stamsii TaxID=1277351 RepID=A0A2V2N582_9EURY|nr:hypothetical protein [Methanospirillum stamsii]PWR74979.1 hypothetical protein DLD82_07065 [Methanospirillum stamsii]
MSITPAEERQIRPCSVCAFFVYTTNCGEGRCNLAKDEREDYESRRWELSELSDLIRWPCMFNLTPEEIEVSVDSWVKSLVNESLRFRTSVQSRRSMTSNRRTKGRKF